MTRTLVRTLALLLFLIPLQGSTQDQTTAADTSTSTQVTRDSAAVNALQQTVAAMGGPNAIAAIRDCVATGYVQPSPANPQPAGAFKWKHAGREFRYENPGKADTETLVSGHGKPAFIRSDGADHLHGHMARADVAPHLIALILWRVLNNPAFSIGPAEGTAVAGRPAVRVRIWNNSTRGTRAITPQLWYLDVQTGVPFRLEYKLPDNNNGLMTRDAAVEFADYRAVSGVLVPYQIIIYVDGTLLSTIKLDTVTFNTGVTTDQFDAPAGGDK